MQVLTNPKTPLIRKRQMMQQLFGDYRQKMRDEDIATQKRMFFDMLIKQSFVFHN